MQPDAGTRQLGQQQGYEDPQKGYEDPDQWQDGWGDRTIGMAGKTSPGRLKTEREKKAERKKRITMVKKKAEMPPGRDR